MVETLLTGHTKMPASNIDYADIQGLVRFGYGYMHEACFLLLQVKDPAAAQTWLAAAPVTNAVKADPRPSTALQVAFTCEGLRALDLDERVIEEFAPEFVSRMAAEESRSRRLGDTGANSPQGWAWGGPETPAPHLLLLLYAENGLTEWRASIEAQLSDGFHTLACLETSWLNGREHFGFQDGISEPVIDWAGERRVDKHQLEYSNLVALGEFLFGYPNEYGEYTDRPLLSPAQDPRDLLPVAEDRPGRKDLGRNGTFLVLRQLQQDPLGFWRFLDQQTDSHPQARQQLAESMVGRTMDGEPLVPLSEYPIAGVDNIPLNQFTYQSDPDGTHCPLGAHIRRGNPRNADFPYGTKGLLSRLIRTLGFGREKLREDLIASTRFHRILRRGRTYGQEIPLDAVFRSGQSDNEERGIHFICLNANIARQFEFVQNAWIMSTKFDGLSRESDPLLGNREPVPGCPVTDVFSLPQEQGVRRQISALPQFVRVRGGAYFFLPGIRALRYLAGLDG